MVGNVRATATALFLATLLLMLAQASGAGKRQPGGGGKKANPIIDVVEFRDLKGNKKLIEILGSNLDGGSRLSVSLDGVVDLFVRSVTDSTIEAEVSASLEGDFTLVVSTGTQQDALFDIHLGGSLSVVCIDWYLTTGGDQHIHAEAFVQDENGDPVIGAPVTLENTVDGEVYQIYSSTTFKYAGYNHGESCPIEVAQASGATGQACCIGNATDPPEDSRSCPPGLYESLVLSVQAPPGSDRRWDEVTPPNGFQFTGP